jgi:hypothetical protein
MDKNLNKPARRVFLKNAGIATLSLLISLKGFSKGKGAAIILRSSWQTVNIGDIGHTPGVIALLEKYLPDLKVLLWPTDVGDGVEEMIMKRFPKLTILKTDLEKENAMDEAVFFLHGSGPSLVGRTELEKWGGPCQ